MNEREALRLALEALKQIDEAMPFPVAKLAQKAIREVLAQPESPAVQGEPVAWYDPEVMDEDRGISWTPGQFHTEPLYTTPQPAVPERKPLSMQERTSIVRANKSFHDKNEIDAYGIIDDVEAAHGIKGDA